ncbi:MAG: hypothetical protein QOD92_2562 [Acidimicrobiaceae bacterium]
MSRKLVERVGAVLAAHTDRRGFIQRSAIAGSALAVNPATFIFKPISAYAAVCECRSQPCGCGTACCDGYTEFCCTLTGTNTCPPGTVAGGWWKADGSNFCGGAARYYLDCNVAPGANPCSCGCALGDCNHRVQCCTHFRYGQCHQELPQLGAIMCRVVTCTPPWQFDATCTTTVATDQATAAHDAVCLHTAAGPAGWYLRVTDSSGPAEIVLAYGLRSYRFLSGDWDGDGVDTVGVWDPSTATFYLRNSNSPGAADVVVQYGASSYVPLVGDWNGDGKDTIGVWDPSSSTFLLRNSTTPGAPNVTVPYGQRGDRPIVGDFGGLGIDAVGVVGAAPPAAPAAHTVSWYLRNSNTAGAPDVSFAYGTSAYRYVAGDWDGDGRDGVGVWDPATGTFYLRNTATAGAPEITVHFGVVGVNPIVGNWDGAGGETVGIYADGEWRLRNSNTAGAPDLVFAFGAPGYLPVVGDWLGTGRHGVGVWDPATGSFYLRNTATPGPPELTVKFGTSGYLPLAGDWTGAGHDGIGMWDPANANFYLRTAVTAGPPDITVHYGAASYVPIVGDWDGTGTTTVGVIA